MDFSRQEWRMEWVVIPFSRGFSWPRDQTHVAYIAGRFFTIWATRESPFSTINALFFLSIVYSFGRKSLQRAHTQWRVMLYLLKGWVYKYLEFFSWEICVFFHIYWLIQSCISVWLKGIYFIVWVIIQYYFIQLFMLLQLWPLGALSLSLCAFDMPQ